MLTPTQRECLNKMADHGGMNISVLRAAVAYIAHLEEDNARLVEAKNEVVRELHAERNRGVPETV